MTESLLTATTRLAPTHQWCGSGRTATRLACRIRVVIGLLFAGVVMLSTALPAFAHTALVASDPADGAALADPPDSVTLIFDGVLQRDFTQVVVLDAGGAHHEYGEPHVDLDTVSQPLGTLGEGVFRVSYRVVAADGHPVTGTLSFTVAASSASAGAPTTSAPAAPSPLARETADETTTAGRAVDLSWSLIFTSLIVIAGLSTALAVLVLRRARRTDNGSAHIRKPEDASEER